MRDQRGAVLPLAMMILVVLSAVLITLSGLTGQEPLIASNHVMVVQAQALAEAGLERALWALSTPESADGIPWSATAPAPYDGSAFLGVATESGAPLGGYRLTVTGEGDRQRGVTVVGLVPGDFGPLGRARQDISATLIRLRFPDPPAGRPVPFAGSGGTPTGVISVTRGSGQPIPEAPPAGDFARVTIGDGAAGPAGAFRGWIIVNGSLSVTGDITLRGLTYVADRLSQTGAARLVGAAMAGHVRTPTPSLVDARPTGAAVGALGLEEGRTGRGPIPARWVP